MSGSHCDLHPEGQHTYHCRGQSPVPHVTTRRQMSWVLSQNGPTWSQHHPPLSPHPLGSSSSCLNVSGVGGSLSWFLHCIPQNLAQTWSHGCVYRLDGTEAWSPVWRSISLRFLAVPQPVGAGRPESTLPQSKHYPVPKPTKVPSA